MNLFKTSVFITFFFITSHLHSQISQDQNSYESKISVAKYDNLPVNPETNNKFRYFYYPNLQAYFDNVSRVFYFKLNGEWIINDQLPPNYGGYSLFNNRRVIIEDYLEDKPYEMIQIHKVKYPYSSKGRFNKES